MPHFGDEPITSETEDRFSRAEFSSLVVSICASAATSSDSSVIGLIGPWGSGKTSVLNLARAEMEKQENWRVVSFNPWLFSDIDTLLAIFFAELSHVLPGKRQTREKLAKYVQSISPFGRALSLLGADLGDALQETAEIIRGDTSHEKYRKELEDSLRASRSPLLVTIDDIDRLQPAELLVLFKLIRLVGRLPHVHYLISFDETTVLDLLERSDVAFNQRDRAQSYLEKIVQVRLDLPPLQDVAQWDTFLGGCEELLSSNAISPSNEEEERIFISFNTYMRHKLRHPRAIKRLLIQFQIELTLAKRRLDIADHIVITFLRVFEPQLYTAISWSRDDLAPRSFDSLGYKAGEEARKTKWRDLCGIDKTAIEASQLSALLSQAFPSLKLAAIEAPFARRDPRTTRRVSDPRFFDEYFQLSGQAQALRDADILDALPALAANNLDHPAARRLTATLRARPSQVLYQIDDLREAGQIQNPAALIQFLARHYASIFAAGRYEGDPVMLTAILANLLTKQMTTGDTVNLFRSLIAAGYMSFVTRATERIIQPTFEGPMDWGAPVASILREALYDLLQELGQRPLEDVSEAEFNLVTSYARMDPETARRAIWRLVEDHRWKVEDILARLVNVQRFTTPEGLVTGRLQRLHKSQIESVIDIDNVLKMLSLQLDKGAPGSFEEFEGDPSVNSRKEYALSVLRQIRSAESKRQDS